MLHLYIERIATRHMKSPSPAKEHMMCSFRHTAFSGGCHLRVACHLVRSEFHPAYPNAPLPDDSSRDDADRRANIRGAPPATTSSDIASSPIAGQESPTVRSDAPIDRLLLRYVCREQYLCARTPNEAGVATAASANQIELVL